MTANKAIFDWAPDLLAFLRNSWRTVAICTLCTGAAAAGYIAVATPRFTAASTVLLDMQAAAPFKEQNTPIDSQFANGIAESQVEVLQSEGLARVVVDRCIWPTTRHSWRMATRCSMPCSAWCCHRCPNPCRRALTATRSRRRNCWPS